MDTFTGRFGARELALSASFGLLLGLMPKSNLLFVLCVLLFFLSHANIIFGLLATGLVSFVSPWIHPICHRIGGDLLTREFGQQLGARLFQIPGMPWTDLNNSVVLGSFLVGLILFIPVFFLFWIPLKILGFGAKTETSTETEPETPPTHKEPAPSAGS